MLPYTISLDPSQESRGATTPRTDEAAAATADAHDALPAGYRLAEFEIVRVLGAGGFGIVYLALDQVLLRYVAIKEYFPTTLAGRNPNAYVDVRSRDAGRTFDLGLESFINEARLLASFDHPSLVKVFRFWKQNGTGYMVMQYYPGQTLKEARRAMGSTPPAEEWLRGVMEPLLGALETLHAQDVYHRDIAPDNILLLPDGQPVILDFGSARRVIADRTQSLTAVLKPNFSPVEQYADDAGMRQGAYTDLFALGGTVRYMLTGEAPTPAVMRAVRDTLPAMSQEDPARYPGVSAAFLATIDWSLALAPGDRPQTVAQWREALRGEIEPPAPTPRHLPAADVAPTFGPTAALAKTALMPPSPNVPRPRGADVAPTIDLRASAHRPLASATAGDARAARDDGAMDRGAPVGGAGVGDDGAEPPRDGRGAPIAGARSRPHPKAGSTAPRPRSKATAAVLAACVALGLAGAWAYAGHGATDDGARRPSVASESSTPSASSTTAPSAVAVSDAAAQAAPQAVAQAAPQAALQSTAQATAAAPAAHTDSPAHHEAPRATTPQRRVAATSAAVTAATDNHGAAQQQQQQQKQQQQQQQQRAADERFMAQVATRSAAPAPSEKSTLDACASLGFFARAACVSRACAAPALRSAPACVQIRRADEERQRRMEQ